MDWIQLRSLVLRSANKMSSNLQFHVTDLISKSCCTQSSWVSQLTFMFNYWRWKTYLKIKSNLQFHVTDLISPIPLFARSHIWLLSGSTTCNISPRRQMMLQAALNKNGKRPCVPNGRRQAQKSKDNVEQSCFATLRADSDPECPLSNFLWHTAAHSFLLSFVNRIPILAVI